MSFGRYQFLPWARRGLASEITEQDTLGTAGGAADERAHVPLRVTLSTGDVEPQDLALTGPGEVVGVNARTIIRTEPLNGIADYEPNLLPHVEFYDEDFPFRYTPAAAVGAHLRPWLALVVLKENEFVETRRREPLTSIQVISESVLPAPDELHLWCHVHSNLPHEEGDLERFVDSLEEDLASDPDGVYSRLLCPRRLEPKTLYHAFLVPAYETGRRAGLGQPTVGVKAQTPSWPGQGNELPVYHRWYFRTGKNVDFELLVKQLEPRIMDDRVGVREMDCSRPGFVRADTDTEVRPPTPEVLLLGGAVMAPGARPTAFPSDGGPQPFLEDLEKLVNLNRAQEENPDEDPFVSVPYYGQFHAMRRDPDRPGRRATPPFDPDSQNWYDDLNRDPGTRVPAGFGVRVVQENQERFVDIAWKQLSEVQEANRRTRRARFAAEVVGRLYDRTLATMPNESFLATATSMSARVLAGDRTVKATVDRSIVANATLDSAFARVTRRNASIVRRLDAREGAATFSYERMFRRMNSVGGLSAEVEERFSPPPVLASVMSFEAPSTATRITTWSRQSNLAEDFVLNQRILDGGLPTVDSWTRPFAPAPVTSLPPGRAPTTAPGRTRIRPGTPSVPAARATPSAPLGGAVLAARRAALAALRRDLVIVTTTVADNRVATRQHDAQVKAAYREVTQRFQFRKVTEPAPVLATAELRKALDRSVRPAFAYRRLLDAGVRWPAGVFRPPGEDLLPAMAYPDIPDATYRFLVDIDKEFLLPNLHLIENNTLSLLRTNQRFIESYLVGLNYEMGRELLWREYPTDLRGSYFRQFWDVSGFVTPDTTPEDSDALKDIRPIHMWPRASRLGRHNHRDAAGDAEQLVFVVRGDLLKKFPNTVIFAQKALVDSEDSDRTVIRTGELTDAQYEKEIRFPLYQAQIEPDIKLLGFDLTIDEASGRDSTPGFGNDRRGWYFILAEVVGEPRFGMDIRYRPNDTSHLTWNDLSWENLPEGARFVQRDVAPALAVHPDVESRWGRSSAHMAAILLQRPVMVAIHATEMLDVDVAPELDFQVTSSLFEHIAHVRRELG